MIADSTPSPSTGRPHASLRSTIDTVASSAVPDTCITPHPAATSASTATVMFAVLPVVSAVVTLRR